MPWPLAAVMRRRLRCTSEAEGPYGQAQEGTSEFIKRACPRA